MPIPRDLRHDSEFYAGVPSFHEFVDREFDQIAAQAPVDDLCVFAFGGVEEAIRAYEASKDTLEDEFDTEDEA